MQCQDEWLLNMGPIWGQQDPGGPHVGPMNFAIWVIYQAELSIKCVNVQNRQLTFIDWNQTDII